MERCLKYILSVFIILNSGIRIYAQQQLLPLGELYQNEINFNINKTNLSVNTGFKPLLKSEVLSIFNIDSAIYHTQNADRFFTKHKRNWLYRKLFFEDFVYVNTKEFTLSVNPLFYLETGKVSGNDSTNFFINTRGIEIKGDIGKKISYYSTFRENQARFRDYVYNRTWQRLVVPGQGAIKKNNKDLSLYDFSSASAYLSYTPFEWLNVRLGQDKNFIGEGHRSLFLSDNAMNYPFINLSFNYKKFKYVTMFTQFRDFEGAIYLYHFQKHGAFNYLSYNYNNRIEIGLFEGVIYRTTDTSEYVNKFPADFFIPVIGVRTAINGFAADNNVLAGIDMKLKISDYIQLYGQFAVDDPKQQKFAYQGGFKIFDLLFSEIKNLKWYLQAEYNAASPRTYSHVRLKYQTWSHYNQELAVPFGADFSEIFLTSDIHYKNLVFNFKYNYVSLNRNGTFSDIYMLDNNTYLLMPEKKIVSHKILSLSYIINRRTDLQIYAGADFRISEVGGTKNTEKYIMFGLKTALSNFYYDF